MNTVSFDSKCANCSYWKAVKSVKSGKWSKIPLNEIVKVTAWQMKYSRCTHSDSVQMETYHTEKFIRRATKEGANSRDKLSKSNNRSCGLRLTRRLGTADFSKIFVARAKQQISISKVSC